MAPRPAAKNGPGLPGGSIGARVSVAVTAVAGGVLAVFVAFDTVQSHGDLHEAERRALESVIPAVGHLVETSMLAGNRGHVAEVLGGLSGRAPLYTVELLDSDRRAIETGDFLRGKLRPRRREPAPSPEHAVDLVVPLKRRPDCARCHAGSADPIGYLRVAAVLPRVFPMLLRQARQRAVLAVVALVIAGLLCAALVRALVDAPVREVVRGLDRVREGHLDVRLRAELPGELALISSRFNAMVEQLESSRRQIAELHRRQVTHLDRLVSIGELAANLAHEVRNPLTGISSSIQVLRRGLPEGDSRREVLSRVLDQVDRLNRTIGNFLHYARMPEAEVRPFDLREPLQRAKLLLNDRIRAQRVALEVDLPGALPAVQGDPGQVEQVLLNLCLNSLQAMPEGGSLRLGAAVGPEKDVVVEVRDTGNGIPPENLEDVFKLFFTTRKDGNGLGLPISRQLVENMGGELWLESVPGAGTSAFIRLPRHRPEAA